MASGAPATGSYRWYTDAASQAAISGQTGDTFTTPVLAGTSTYYVATVSSQGCESQRVPVPAYVYHLDTVAAGPDEEVCIDDAPFALQEAMPAGGTWSGVGIGPSGVFQPAAAGAGIHTLKYTFTCQTGGVAETFRQIRVVDVQGKPGLARIGLDSLVADITGARYEWEVNGKTFSSSRNRIRITGPGFYKVRVVDGKCTSEISDIFIASFSAQADFLVFPNPSHGLVVVSGPALNEALEIEIFNTIGQRVYARRLSRFSGEAGLDLRHLSPALYLMVFKTGQLTKVEKLSLVQ
jgi:hypothetical protein